MKKFLISLFTISLVISGFVFNASAATKSDIIDELNKTIIKNVWVANEEGKGAQDVVTIKIMAENIISSTPVSSDQADKIIALIRECSAVVPEYKGVSAHMYTNEQRAYVTPRVFEAFETLGFKCEFIIKNNNVHDMDIVFSVSDPKTGKVVFEYDGDLIRKTDSPSFNYDIFLYVGGALLVISGGLFFFVRKKRIQ